MKVYRITKGDTGRPLILDNLQEWNDILGAIENEEVGDIYTISIEEMPRVNDLPEWDGF